MAPTEASVAVITRTKDRALLLERAIRSVMQQTMADLQMVIVNDGGDPGPVDNRVKRYDHIIKGRAVVVHHPESKGMEPATNSGIRASNSRYVALLDDDDTWHPRFLEKTVGAMTASEKLGAVTATRIYVEDVRLGDIRLYDSIRFNDVVHEGQEDDGTGKITWRREQDRKVTARARELNAKRARPTTLTRLPAINQWPNCSFVYARSVFDVIGHYDET